MGKKKIDYKKVFDSKKPTQRARYIGLEIEFFADVTEEILAFVLDQAGLTKYACLKDDGSIDHPQGTYSHELCLLMKESEYVDIVRRTCAVLRQVNAEVNRSCGLHVHLDMRQKSNNVRKIFSNLVTSQDILYAMNPKSRQGTFSKKVKVKDVDHDTDGDRYYGINREALSRYQTLEIRIHAGTVNADKIVNWIKLLIHLKNYKGSLDTITVNDLKTKVNIDDNLYQYVLKRISQHTKAA